MNQDVNEFLDAIKDKTNSKLADIQKSADPDINAIKKQINGRIANLESEGKSLELPPEVISTFQRIISDKQIEWLKQTNTEKGRLIDQLLANLEKQFQSLVSDPEFYDLLSKFFMEVELKVGKEYEVHIPTGSDPEKFKSASNVKQKVIADLDKIGILVKRLDAPISVENTLQSRFAKKKEDLIIEAAQMLWNDLEESPWQFKKVMNHLLSKE